MLQVTCYQRHPSLLIIIINIYFTVSIFIFQKHVSNKPENQMSVNTPYIKCRESLAQGFNYVILVPIP